MKTYRTMRTALRALRRNPMRAALTTLGIIIGVGAVIAMMEIGAGSSAAIQKTIASMGANTLMVHPGTASSSGVSFGSGSIMTLTPDDCEAIMKECTAVKTAAPVVRTRTQIVCGDRNWVPTFIYGSSPAYFDVREWNVPTDGELFTDLDVLNSSKVCLVGQSIVRELFDGRSPLGKEIRINNVSLRIVGVLRQKGANMMGMDQDDVIVAPWTTIKYNIAGSSITNATQSRSSTSSSTSSSVNTISDIYPSSTVSLYPEKSSTQAANNPMLVRFTNVDEIQVLANSSTEVQLAIRQITSLLRDRHRIRPGQPDDFVFRNMAELSSVMTSTTRMMTNLLLCVALISLVVGGVGIMNIMLVSVTERTHEIGLRMAVGAQSRDILTQFLVEAVVLCLLGGALGILLGHGGSLLVRYFLKWPVMTSPAAIIAAVVVSATVGIVFGYYPAWKASRLDPIEALRYE
ncbi:MAG: ABC transporter permease [Anaerohalosphaeraceae bacterium]